MKRYLIFALLLIAALSCSEEPAVVPAPEEPSAEDLISLSAQLPGADSRVVANTTDNDGFVFSWENQDALGNWHSGCTSTQKFTNGAETGKEAAFSGKLGKGDTHRFIFPYEEVALDGESTTYPIDMSIQNGNFNKTFFITQNAYTREQLTSGEVTTLPMEHIGAFMIVEIYLQDIESNYECTLKRLKYSSADNAINTSAEIDMTKAFDDELFYQKLTPGSITADFDVKFEDLNTPGSYKKRASTKFNILPSIFASGQTITIEATIEYRNLNSGEVTTRTKKETIENNTIYDLPLARASHNYTELYIDTGFHISSAAINDWGMKVDKGDLEIGKNLSYVEFKRNEPNTANMKKIDNLDAIENLLSKFRRCLMTTDGSGNATICYLDNNNSTLYNDGSAAALDGTEGDVMVYFPEFWYKYENINNNYFRYYFSESAEEGYIHVEASLLGAYKAHNENNMVYSRSGVTPTNNVSQADFKSYAAARGAGYQIIDYEQHCTIAMMLYAKYLDRNTQAKIGLGAAETTTTTGSTNAIGNADTKNESSAWVNGLGIEGVFGGTCEWIDGVEVDNYVWTITNPTDNTTREVIATSSADGWIYGLSLENGNYFDMVPTVASWGNNSSYYFTDFYFYHSGPEGRIIYRSSYNGYGSGGVAYVNAVPDSSCTSDHVGSRLSFRGTITEAASVAEYKALLNN